MADGGRVLNERDAAASGGGERFRVGDKIVAPRLRCDVRSAAA